MAGNENNISDNNNIKIELDTLIKDVSEINMDIWRAEECVRSELIICKHNICI